MLQRCLLLMQLEEKFISSSKKNIYLSNVKNECFTVGVANDDETNNWLVESGEALKKGDSLALFNKFGEELLITVDSMGKPVCNEKFLKKVSESLKKENN